MIVLDAESELLSGMRMVDREVFYCLADSVDLRTGFIGLSSKVSRWYVASALSDDSVGRVAKNSLVKVSVDNVRRSIERLVFVGLFENHSEDRKLVLLRVFWVDLLAVVKSVQNPDVRADVRADAGVVSSEIKILSFLFNGLCDYSSGSCVPDVRADVRADAPLSKPLSTTSDFVNKFRLSLGFIFDGKFVKDYLAMRMVDFKKINPDWTAEFIGHWATTGKELTSPQWHDKYCKQMIRFVRNPNLFAELNGLGDKSSASSAGKNVRGFIPRLPKDNEQLAAFALKWGLPAPGNENSYWEYRAVLDAKRVLLMDKKQGVG